MFKVIHKTQWFMSINADSYAFRANHQAQLKGLTHSKELVQLELDSICDKKRQAFYELQVIEV